jgi:hypothetical protein
MLEKSSQKIIVVLGVLALLAVFGYYTFNNSSTDATPEEIIQQNTVGQDIIVLAEKLNSININDSVFTSAVFLSLIDRDIPIIEESQGRINPFDQIGSEGGNINNKSSLKPPVITR